MATVLVPGPLRAAAGGRSRLQIGAADLAGLVRALGDACPDLADALLREDGRIRPHVNLFINGRLHPSKSVDGTPLSPDDEILVLPAVSGG